MTSTTGTGLVHTAPAHGVEDWEAWRAYSVAQRSQAEGEEEALQLADTVCAVDGAGRLMPDVLSELVDEEVAARLGGKEVLGEGTGAVIELLQERGALLREVEVTHKFPYDWRTKKPVIFRYVATRHGGSEALADLALVGHLQSIKPVVRKPRECQGGRH